MHLYKTRLTAVAALVVGAMSAPAYGFKVDWSGDADGVDAYDENNWFQPSISGPPAAGTIDPGVPINQFLEISGAASEVDASAGAFTLGTLGIMQVLGSGFVTTDVIRRDTTPDVFNSANATLIISNISQVTGSVQASALAEINVSLIDQLTLTSGDNPLVFTSVIFSASGNSSPALRLTNESVADAVAEHLGKISVGGASFSAVIGSDPSVGEPGDNLLIVSDGATGSILTPIIYEIPPGDTDGDGDIDDADLGTMISNFTGPIGAAGGKTHALGDTDGDGDVDDADLGTSISGFTGPQSLAAVPEPASLAALCLGGLLLVRRR